MTPLDWPKRRWRDPVPPLALYIHVPWCLRKCPYCDFNSHTLRERIPEAAYVAALLGDLDLDLSSTAAPAAPLVSVFVGGGTPSLLSGSAVDDLLGGIRSRLPLQAAAEVTLEANPGASDTRRFDAYRAAGVNRLSLGAQSLSAAHLQRLGRTHGPEEVRDAVLAGRQAGFDNINLDLMYGLPDQSLSQARRDLEQALDLEPEHMSYYQLTVEPNTAFFAAPPPVPDDDLAADMHQQGMELLAARGFARYETSAYARPGRRCVHNLNYWSFGDYVGIGAGAHGKRSDGVSGSVERTVRLRHPRGYLNARREGRFIGSRRRLTEEDLVLEFTMNALRLVDGFDRALFEQNTGLEFATISKEIAEAKALGLLEQRGRRVRASERGGRFLNDLVAIFARTRGFGKDPEVI